MTERPFDSWAVLAAAFVVITMSIGTLFTLGVFLKPIEDSMGWSRSGIGAIGLFSWIVMGAGGVVSGYVSDRVSTRRVVLVGAVLLAAGLVLSSHVQQVWHLYVTFGLLVGAGVSAFYVPLTVLAIKWFEGRRGMAASVVSAGNGLGILTLAPLTRWLIDQYDWRVAFFVLGNLAFVVVVPCALLLRNPSAAGARTWPPHSPSRGQPERHAMDQGVAKMAAAGILGASGLMSVFGRIGTGIVADRVGAKRTLLAALSLQALLIFLYLFASGTGALYAVSLAFGVAYGGAMPLYALVTREYFGERVVGTAYGAVFFISCIGMGWAHTPGAPSTTCWAPTRASSWAPSPSASWRLCSG